MCPVWKPKVCTTVKPVNGSIETLENSRTDYECPESQLQHQELHLFCRRRQLPACQRHFTLLQHPLPPVQEMGYQPRTALLFTASNLLTWTSYSGMDPEVNQYGNSGSVQGIDYGTYPQSKSFVFGINVEF